MQDVSCRPALAADDLGVGKYDVIPHLVGREPSVINSFVEAPVLAGKRVIPFCISDGGGFANRVQLEKLVLGLEAHEAL